ncbi:hypothetical protein B0I27_106130 [Arcticibacter pallidicorallinus]|uniref:Uncharacterized protein n=2 Tax=Arcticibacter pallidicorallinus TaxID=1259464 RepID=A0A2T0U388_9SPHI|nr:hypothetical protein [Arcticibacter pallidicorallinus]PRY52370.1 hypothetical protein B0I27_106130 [Arcticibacter pallidicorallinus]
MQEPFDIEVGEVEYAVFPEEDDTYTIFKDGVEYLKIQKDTEKLWLKLDSETDLPLFSEDEEVRLIGQQISAYLGE